MIKCSNVPMSIYGFGIHLQSWCINIIAKINVVICWVLKGLALLLQQGRALIDAGSMASTGKRREGGGVRA